MKFKKGTAIALAAVLTTTSIAAHSDGGDKKRFAESQYRHDVMEIAKYSLANILQTFKGETELKEHLPLHAQNLANAAAMSKAAFEKDTRGMDGHTEAKDAIWENWEDYAARSDKFAADAAAFAEAAKSGDMGATQATFRKMVGNCKACHDDYRD